MPTATSECRTAQAPHVPPTRPDAEPIEWKRPDGSPYRSKDATCTFCGPTVYLLVAMGGALRIMKTVNGQPGAWISPPATSRQTRGWWDDLLVGRAI